MAILADIANAVAYGETEKLGELIKKALDHDISASDVLQKGLSKGVKIVGDKFENMELYLPDLMSAADAMIHGVEIVKPYLKDEPKLDEGTVVLATIQGDIHNIGKNIVGFYLGVSGFKVHDIGTDITPITIVDEAEGKMADIIGVSALMTSTMTYVPDVIDELKRRGIRDKYIVMVGGAAVTPEWVKEIGADGYGDDFAMAEKVAKKLMRARRKQR